MSWFLGYLLGGFVTSFCVGLAFEDSEEFIVAIFLSSVLWPLTWTLAPFIFGAFLADRVRGK